MDFRLSEQHEAWRDEVRAFLQETLPRDWGEGSDEHWTVSDEAWEFSLQFQRELGRRGWLALAWPREYGGQERSFIEQMVFNEEMAYHRAPLGRVGTAVGFIGPTIILHGTDKQKERYLPAITRGEVTWCQGFSEPNAGSDLASLQTRAIQDGDDFIITGQKIWQSAAHHADLMLLAARTDPEAPKHRGISLFIVDMHSPGISVRPIKDMRDAHYFNEVFFDSVRVPRENLVGELHRGWYAMTTTLDLERSNVGASAALRRTFDDFVAYVQTGRVTLRPQHRDTLAELAIELQVARMLAYRVVSLQQTGLVPNHESSISKLFASELSQRLTRALLEILGLAGQLRPTVPNAPMGGGLVLSFLESPANTIRAGTSEIQRNIIAQRGLGLPRA